MAEPLSADGLGVGERESARGKHWEDLGLPDPILDVLSPAEGKPGSTYGAAARDELAVYFDTHPDETPPGW